MDEIELREALAEALRRNPSLADDTSPEGLTQLRLMVADVAQELRIQRELEAMRAQSTLLFDVSNEPAPPTDANDAAGDSAPDGASAASPARRGLLAVGGVLVLVVLALITIAFAVKTSSANSTRAAASMSAMAAYSAFAAEASGIGAQVSADYASQLAAAAEADALAAEAAAASASADAQLWANMQAAQSARSEPWRLKLEHAVNCQNYGGYDPDNPDWAC